MPSVCHYQAHVGFWQMCTHHFKFLTQNSSVAQAGFELLATLLSQSPKYLELQA